MIQFISNLYYTVVRFTWWWLLCVLGWWEMGNFWPRIVLITISVYVVISTNLYQGPELDNCVSELDLSDELELFWTLTVARDGSLPTAAWKLISKGQSLNVWNYIVITASNWCQLATQEIKRSFCFHYQDPSIHGHPSTTTPTNVIKKTSYLSVSGCRMKKTSFSVVAAQSVSISGVEDKPTHEILSSVLK